MSRIQTFDASVAMLGGLLWQHNRAEGLQSIAHAKQEWYDANFRDFWDAWVRDVFDLRTANAFGCQVWARLLGLRLNVATDAGNDGPRWGFGADFENFENGTFGPSSGDSLNLTTEQQRILLRLRYYRLVGRNDVPGISAFMNYVFAPYGKVNVLDDYTMGPIVYVFDFALDSNLEAAMLLFDVLPRPSCVGVEIETTVRPVFGFGATNENFDNGTFATSD